MVCNDASSDLNSPYKSAKVSTDPALVSLLGEPIALYYPFSRPPPSLSSPPKVYFPLMFLRRVSSHALWQHTYLSCLLVGASLYRTEKFTET